MFNLKIKIIFMLKIDLHIHTIASGHAYNTIFEYINRAKELKMKIIGFSEHGPSVEGSVCETYFKCLNRLPRYVDGIMILRGAEANIVDRKGTLDISDKTIEKKLDYVIAHFHKETGWKNQGIKVNTATLVKTIKSGKINIIAHPYLHHVFPLDIKKISEEACRNNVLLEINFHYLSDGKIKDTILSDLKIMVETVKRYKKKILLSSDAHNIWELADDSALKKIKKKIGLTDSLIINNYPKELLKLLKIKK